MVDFAKSIYVSKIASNIYNLYWEVKDLAIDAIIDYYWYEAIDHDDLWDIVEEQGFDPEELLAKLDASKAGKTSLTEEF
jgi:hypothetical protein